MYGNTHALNTPAVEPQIVTEGVVTTGIMGQSTTLSCAADGVPTPIIYWLKGGQIILPNEGDKYGITDSLTTPGQRAYITETRTSSLTISSLDAQDAGMFTCVADNNIGRNGVQTVSYQLQVQCKYLVNANSLACFVLTFVDV